MLHPFFSRLCCLLILICASCGAAHEIQAASAADKPPFGPAQRIGQLESHRLSECSGMAASSTTDNLFWAINDSGNSPCLHALNAQGLDLGTVCLQGAENRDWEAIDTFVLDGRAFLLIADCGDNRRQRKIHTLYVVAEPAPAGETSGVGGTAAVAWTIRYQYPDRPHDAEAVAVDPIARTVLILTKRDDPPLLFTVSLTPPDPDTVSVARLLTPVAHIPPPTATDRKYRYGAFRSWPTAMDLDPQAGRAVVLTYKHAYLFVRARGQSWASAFRAIPRTIPLPLPQDTGDLGQREAICFGPAGRNLFVTAEGAGAGLYRLMAQ